MRKIAYVLWGMLSILVVPPAYSSDAIEIAAIYSLTGEAAAANAPSLQGVRNAVDEINGSGGILGKRVELNTYDNQSTPIGSHLAAVQAADSGAVAIIGAAWSSHSLPIADVAQSRGIPMISDYSTNTAVTQAGNYIFRVCFTDNFQGVALARFAHQDLKARTAASFINLSSDYSIGLSQIFRENFERLGGRVVYEAEYKTKQKHFGDLIEAVKKTQADILLLSGHDESGLIAKWAQDADIRSIPIGGDGCSTQSFLTKGGQELKRAYYCSHWSDSVDLERSRAFVSKYRESPNFGVGMALAYDAVMVLANALRRAESTDRAAIRDALARTRDYQGVTGNISFDEQGDPVKSVVIMEILDGKPIYLKTLDP